MEDKLHRVLVFPGSLPKSESCTMGGFLGSGRGKEGEWLSQFAEVAHLSIPSIGAGSVMCLSHSDVAEVTWCGFEVKPGKAWHSSSFSLWVLVTAVMWTNPGSLSGSSETTWSREEPCQLQLLRPFNDC